MQVNKSVFGWSYPPGGVPPEPGPPINPVVCSICENPLEFTKDDDVYYVKPCTECTLLREEVELSEERKGC